MVHPLQMQLRFNLVASGNLAKITSRRPAIHRQQNSNLTKSRRIDAPKNKSLESLALESEKPMQYTSIYTNPPKECNVCSARITTTLYDCCVPGNGIWFALCPTCFKDLCCNLGTGLGQQYELKDGEYRKVAG